MAVHQGSGWAWEEQQCPETGLERTAGLACDQLHPAVTAHCLEHLFMGSVMVGNIRKNWGETGAAFLAVFPREGDPGIQDQNMF